jgi:hypothetical protein
VTRKNGVTHRRSAMKPTSDEHRTVLVIKKPEEGGRQQGDAYRPEDWKLRRWLVSFASGPGWYPVGEFVALDAAAAIGRAVEIFGPAAGHRAEEIPWDAAPLPRPKPRERKN